ncbi:MAG: transglycosylase domain-containing protein, partial [Methylophilus sp.]
MNSKRWLQSFLFISIIGSLIVAALLVLMISILYPSLPSLEALTDYHPKLPLRIYDAESNLIGEFGQERRAFVPIEQTPKVMKDAILAIEDRRFYQHNGIDTTGILRAIRNNLTGRGHEGASTITMQVAKNFFSSPTTPRNMWTKIKEALLAIKIENAISKDKILELYLNQIYLGERAYGFAAASRTYFDKDLRQLNLAEAALLAGLPKAPS